MKKYVYVAVLDTKACMIILDMWLDTILPCLKNNIFGEKNSDNKCTLNNFYLSFLWCFIFSNVWGPYARESNQPAKITKYFFDITIISLCKNNTKED